MQFTAKSLGNQNFKTLFGTEYAYYAGSMYKGIASKEMVIALGKAGFLGFLGTGGMKPEAVDNALSEISAALGPNKAFGANILHALGHPAIEDGMVDLYLKHGVRTVEASAFMGLTAPLVRYRCQGLNRSRDGTITQNNHIIAKISRPEVAMAFMSPASEKILSELLDASKITSEQAELARLLPVASAICVESDSGGHTDMGASFAQFPGIKELNKRVATERRYDIAPFVGMAGGIGSAQATAAAFMMGADFVVTGSINQCTVEAGTSDAVKTMLQQLNIQDTEYAPSGDMFELGARVQVMKKGTFFAARSNKLFDLYQRYNGLEELPDDMVRQIEDKYFRRPVSEVWAETETFYKQVAPEVLERASKSPKVKMALVFRWYFIHTTRLALNGTTDQRVDFQVHCGPALGSFNQIVKGGPMERWENRRVAEIAKFLMTGAAEITNQYFVGHRSAETV